MNALRTTGTSADVIRDIFAMHFPKAQSVLDLTYGKGTFWRWKYPFELWANDLYVMPQLSPATQHDFSAWPGTAQFDVVVFDPPFTANGPQKTGRHQDRYGSTRDLVGAPQNIKDVHRLLQGGIVEACRLARQGVIVKTQDVIESGKYHDSETVACLTLMAQGWRVEDKVRLLTARRSQPDAARGSKIKHFRNRPSVFIVAVTGGTE